MRPRPRQPGKPNPALMNKKATVPNSVANQRQIVPEPLAMGANEARAKAAKEMLR